MTVDAKQRNLIDTIQDMFLGTLVSCKSIMNGADVHSRRALNTRYYTSCQVLMTDSTFINLI